jgi:hypothetical protein
MPIQSKQLLIEVAAKLEPTGASFIDPVNASNSLGVTPKYVALSRMPVTKITRVMERLKHS